LSKALVKDSAQSHWSKPLVKATAQSHWSSYMSKPLVKATAQSHWSKSLVKATGQPLVNAAAGEHPSAAWHKDKRERERARRERGWVLDHLTTGPSRPRFRVTRGPPRHDASSLSPLPPHFVALHSVSLPFRLTPRNGATLGRRPPPCPPPSQPHLPLKHPPPPTHTTTDRIGQPLAHH
jgi:hypothetical protein